MNRGCVECQIETDFANCLAKLVEWFNKELGQNLSDGVDDDTSENSEGSGYGNSFQISHAHGIS